MLILNDRCAVCGESALLQVGKEIEEMHAGKENQISGLLTSFIYLWKCFYKTWWETQRLHHPETPAAHYDWSCERDEVSICQMLWKVLWCHVWENTNLEGDGSSWPRRDMMLIKVLIPKEEEDRWCLCWSVWKRSDMMMMMMFLTLLPHVHVMHFPVSVLGLPYAAVGQRVTSVIGIHPKVQMMTGVSHCQLSPKRSGRDSSETLGSWTHSVGAWRDSPAADSAL